MSTIEGVDYSTDRPDPAGLAAVGKHFACRYGGPGSAGKQLTPAEARALTAHGVSIVAGAEGTERGLSGGFKVGAEWARSAHAHYVSCGMPPSRPIYLAADWDVSAAEWPAVRQALAGAASVLGHDRVGVYGGYDVVAWALRDNAARWLWQTYAWSGGRLHPRAHLYQYRNGVSLVGGTVDLDRAMVADYGQWTVGHVPPSTEEDEVDPTQAQQLADTHFTTTHLYGPDGQPSEPLHVWSARVNAALADITAKLGAILEWAEPPASGGTDIGGMLAELRGLLTELRDSPLIDAVAVAQAIGANRDVVDQLAASVAARLGGIGGEITLSGSLSGGITPPPA